MADRVVLLIMAATRAAVTTKAAINRARLVKATVAVVAMAEEV